MSKENLFEEFPPVSTQKWEKVIEHDLKGADYKEQLKWETGEGIDALPFYRREDRKQEDEALLIADHRWDICQNIYEQDIKFANQSALKAVEGGADALTFQVEMQSVTGNIGADMRGTAVQSQEEFSELLEGIDLEETVLHFNTGMLSPAFMAMLLNECEKQQVDSSKINGTFGYDPFSFILKHGRLPNNMEAIVSSLKQLTSTVETKLPNMRTLRVEAGLAKNAGATIAQELGYTLAAGSEYLAMLNRKNNKSAEHPPESLSNSSRDSVPLQKGDASAIHFNFDISGYYFLEIAKLRAARLLWANVLQAYEAEEAQMVIHGTTATWNKSKSEPYTNIIRETTEAMAAAIGGCDTITVQPFDAIQKAPNEFSSRIAGNTQIILKEEAAFAKVSDPSAGSWYIETLTDKIAEAGWNVFQEIEQEGGLLKSIENGTLQTAIAESRNRKAAAVECEERVFIGVNKYIAETDNENEEVLKGAKTVSMHTSENGAEIDFENLIGSIKDVLSDGAMIGNIAPALFDLSSVQIEPLPKFEIEEIKNDE